MSSVRMRTNYFVVVLLDYPVELPGRRLVTMNAVHLRRYGLLVSDTGSIDYKLRHLLN